MQRNTEISWMLMTFTIDGNRNRPDKNGFISISSINRRLNGPFDHVTLTLLVLKPEKSQYKNASSRMHTVRCNGSLAGGLSAWSGGCLLGWGGCLLIGGVCLTLGCLPGQGVSTRGGGLHLPPVDRMTDACENITFPQLLLWTVKITICTTRSKFA